MKRVLIFVVICAGALVAGGVSAGDTTEKYRLARGDDGLGLKRSAVAAQPILQSVGHLGVGTEPSPVGSLFKKTYQRYFDNSNAGGFIYRRRYLETRAASGTVIASHPAD
jgi:hypothetical protein